jgi:glyoxylase-like metal-dependent hydrolase (beta-lactamase superfamily II)
MEIVEGLHAVRLLGSKGYLIVDRELTLIDAGLRGSTPLLRWYLSRIGRSLGDITRIVCTHGHPDHIGGVHEIAALTGAEVLMHPADTARLRETRLRDVVQRPVGAQRPVAGQLVAALTRAPSDPRPLAHGDVFPALGGLEIVHTPGHTPGSVCLYAREHRLLIVGDVLQVIRGRISLPSHLFTEDMAAARRSIGRLAELDVETICFAHFPAWHGDVRDALRAIAA